MSPRRSAASRAVFGSTLTFYIKWNADWSKQHARAEFANNKFAADIYRASWVAELLFEWNRLKETDLPKDLLESFTRGLFVDEPWRPSKQHPFDQLLRSLKYFTKFKAGKHGLEVEKKAEPEED